MSPDVTEVNAALHSAADYLANQVEIGTVLSVSPIQADHDALECSLDRDKWTVQTAFNVTAAVEILRCNRIPAVICNDDLIPGRWKELLDHVALLPTAPSVIVASRRADECLWAEALNLGAYDVLAKPLVALEVTSVLALACLRWRNEHVVTIDSSK